MQIVERAIEGIKPYPHNPRRISSEAITKVAGSIREFGFQQPIVVDKQGVVIAGHARLMAARRLGLKTVPVVVADLPPAKVQAYRIADNRVAQESEWDYAALLSEIDELTAAGLDVALLGFEDTELAIEARSKAAPSQVREIETSPVNDKFWISIRGPLKSQAVALVKLREFMDGIEGVEVELGTTPVDGAAGDTWPDLQP